MQTQQDFIEKVRQLQAKLVNQFSSDTISGREYCFEPENSYIHDAGDIYTAPPEFIDPYSRVNTELFWGMVFFIQSLLTQLQLKDSSETVAQEISSFNSERDARDSVLFAHIMQKLQTQKSPAQDEEK